jgi:PAS domain S-box-containing protein
MKSRLPRYPSALGAVVVATLVRLALDPILVDRAPHSTYLVAVAFSAWIGGLGPALLAAVVSALVGTYLFVPPRHSLLVVEIDSQVSVALNFFVAIVTAWLSASLEAEQRRAKRSAAEALERSELLRITLASIGDAVITTDAAGRVTFMNQIAERLTGWLRQDAFDKPLEVVFHVVDPVTGRRGDELVAPALHRSAVMPVASDRILVTRDGARCWIDWNAAPIQDEHGRASGTVLVFRDTSARKRADEVFRFLARTSAALSGSLEIGHVLSQVVLLPVPAFADWCLVEIIDREEPANNRLVGAHRDPAAQSFFDHWLAERQAALAAGSAPRRFLPALSQIQLRTHVAPDDAGRIEVEPRFDEVWFATSSIAVPLDDGPNFAGTICLATNQRERRFSAADVAWVEDFARRASKAIENACLYHEAKEADARKDEFLAMLGHELRNPLAPMRNVLHSLRTTGLGAATNDRAIAILDNQVEHLVRLVDDLLDVARITRNKIELRRSVVDLHELLDRVVETWRPLLESAGLEFLVNLADEPLRVDADAIRLSQVVANLLSNAAKFTQRGGRIWLSVDRAGDEARIRVRDTGSGVPPEMLPRIFDLFAQAHGASDRAHGGLGIGLTLVRMLVELHGGHVEAFSAGEDKGSEFRVRLPLVERADERADERAPAIEPPKSAPAEPSGHKRVMVVDDNSASAHSLSNLLRLWRHDVVTAEDAFAALEVATHFHPEVVLLDIGLPRMDGYELARQLRRQPGMDHALLVAITGYGQPEDRRRSLEAGIDRHLTKPVDPTQLEALLAAPLGP